MIYTVSNQGILDGIHHMDMEEEGDFGISHIEWNGGSTFTIYGELEVEGVVFESAEIGVISNDEIENPEYVEDFLLLDWDEMQIYVGIPTTP